MASKGNIKSRISKGLIERFEDGIINRENGCWNVNPGVSGGYGKIQAFGKTMSYHRVSYELYNGPIPSGYMVCHKCDNPSCVNPEHLFLGTAKDNMQDKIDKGRHVAAHKGEGHHRARLTEWQVKEIKQHLSKGSMTQYELAEKYGVSQTLINNIKTGKRWGHIK